MENRSYIIHTLQKLVQINSINPSLEKGGGGEKNIAAYIAEELDTMGVQTEVDEILPGRVNVTGTISGKGGGKSLIMNAHMDTVGVEGMENPFSGEIRNGKLYGRGSYDMKGSIAAILAAVKTLSENKVKLNGDLILSFVADEEFESLGTSRFIEKYTADAAIVTEPTDLQICLAHRGFGVFNITTDGTTAHGGNHHLGVDANIKMGYVLCKLGQYSKRLQKRYKHPLCGVASMHVPLIKGGTSLFIYSDKCTIRAERRTLPGETKNGVTKEFYQIIEELKKNQPDFSASVECSIWRDPYEITRDRTIVKKLETATENVLGNHPGFTGHTWWEDSAILGQAGIETIIFGPAGGGIHEKTEWVQIKSVVDLSRILYATAIEFCNDSKVNSSS